MKTMAWNSALRLIMVNTKLVGLMPPGSRALQILLATS